MGKIRPSSLDHQVPVGIFPKSSLRNRNIYFDFHISQITDDSDWGPIRGG